MQIGIATGRSEVLNGIDDGAWNYDDSTHPESDCTMVGGTFFQHPLTMPASEAILLELKNIEPVFQYNLNIKTQQFVFDLNRNFSSLNVPIEARCFSSFFRLLAPSYGAYTWNIFYKELQLSGVYNWEWGWFLSSAHTDEDMERVMSALNESVRYLKQKSII